MKTARERDKPYAVVLNAAPAKRDEKESPVVAQARAFLDRHEIPVWHGQISQRAGYSLTLAAGASASELAPDNAAAAAEIAGLWSAIERSIEAINAAYAGAAGSGAMLAAKGQRARGGTRRNGRPSGDEVGDENAEPAHRYEGPGRIGHECGSVHAATMRSFAADR